MQGGPRARILNLKESSGADECEIAPVAAGGNSTEEIRAVAHAVRDQFLFHSKWEPPGHFVARRPLLDSNDAGALADAVASCLPVDVAVRQELLETVNVAERLEKIRALLTEHRTAA